MILQISNITVYPIKSLPGIDLSTSILTARGLKLDRRWMLVRPDGTFLTQRENPEMIWLQPSLTNGTLRIQHANKSMSVLHIPLQSSNTETIKTTIWGDRCRATLVDQDADHWFSEALDMPCHLVHMPDETRRAIKPKNLVRKNTADDIVSFADGVPYLIVGQASLDDLNGRLKNPVPMSAFRANFVFDGGTAYAEDEWKHIKIGQGVRFEAGVDRARCNVITIDPNTAAFQKEPLKTLASYRKEGNNIFFGKSLHLSSVEGGTINVGDPIVIE